MTEAPVIWPEGAERPEGLIDAFFDYERALMANDLDALDRLFAAGPNTLRGDAAGLLVGHDEISAFRQGRGGASPRTIVSVHAHPVGTDAAVLVAVTEPATGGRGQQTQLWRRIDGHWAVEIAHVSAPAPAINASTWRVVGSPLLAGAADGPLVGKQVAVKDLFSVTGFAVGAGVPEYLADSPRAVANAAAVTALLAAGASVHGIAQTDEFAYSIAGRNAHYGTPPNGAVPGAIPGGSSSGPASAVATGQVAIGLGTDTGGSIRVPASYQGLWGLRTTHGAVSTEGLLPLAPSFDTVGWLTRDASTLRTAAAASLGGSPAVSLEQRFAIAPAIAARASAEVRSAFDGAIDALVDDGPLADLESIDLPDIDDLFEIFRTVQSFEAWKTHGEWIEAHPGALGAEIEARFRFGQSIDEETESFARQAFELARMRIDSILGDRILLLPSASSVAPSATADQDALESLRAATLRLTCVAGLAGRPGLSIPALRVGTAPVGLGIIGPVGTDLALIDVGSELARAL